MMEVVFMVCMWVLGPQTDSELRGSDILEVGLTFNLLQGEDKLA